MACLNKKSKYSDKKDKFQNMKFLKNRYDFSKIKSAVRSSLPFQ